MIMVVNHLQYIFSRRLATVSPSLTEVMRIHTRIDSKYIPVFIIIHCINNSRIVIKTKSGLTQSFSIIALVHNTIKFIVEYMSHYASYWFSAGTRNAFFSVIAEYEITFEVVSTRFSSMPPAFSLFYNSVMQCWKPKRCQDVDVGVVQKLTTWLAHSWKFLRYINWRKQTLSKVSNKTCQYNQRNE